MKRIEFVGISGSGKTTLEKKLAKAYVSVHDNKDVCEKSLNERYKNIGIKQYLRYRIISFFYKNLYVPSEIYSEVLTDFIITHQKKYHDVLDVFLDNNDQFRKKYILKYFFDDIVYYELCKKNTVIDNEYVVFDEWLLHRIMAVENKEMKKISSDVEKTFQIFDFPDLVINVEVDLEQVIERMLKRKSGIPKSFRKLSEAEIRQLLEVFLERKKVILEVLEKKGVKVITVYNNNLEEAFKHLDQELNEYLISKKW